MDPVDVQQIATAALLCGGIIFFGAAYAIFYALGMLRQDRRLLNISYASYFCLLLATIGVAIVMHLTGWWMALVIGILAGYLIAPRFIWKLSVAVHSEEEFDSAIHPSEVNP